MSHFVTPDARRRSTSSNIDSHTATVSGQEASAESPSSFACPRCTKTFSRRENLSRHLKTHDLNRVHQCYVCGRTFTRSDLKKRHEALHTEENSHNKKSPATKAANTKRKLRSILPDDREPVGDGSDQRILYASQIQQITDSGYTVQQPPSMSTSSIENANDQQAGRFVDESLYPAANALCNLHAAPVVRPHHFNNEILSLHAAGLDVPAMELPMQTEPWNHVSQIPLDFTSIFPQQNEDTSMLDFWFNKEVCSALRETGNNWAELGQSPLTVTTLNTITPADSNGESANDQHRWIDDHSGENHFPGNCYLERSIRLGGRIRDGLSSPPNEASEEDGWPFAWDPKSVPILRSKPIFIPDTHPLYHSHDSRFTISETTYSRITTFLELGNNDERPPSQKSTYSMPSLQVTSIFIGLFFKKFAKQVPVLHMPTLDLDKDLPPSLLAIMVVIGSIYSLVRYTRRFAIVLLDNVRRSMQISLEYDISLVRDPMTIYASLLICHAGIWCGNKRAYMLAEMARGTLMTLGRRANLFGRGVNNAFNQQATGSRQRSAKGNDLDSTWRKWVADESNKRLGWAIYSLDCQYPGLLNLPASIHLTEVLDMRCPCDDEFWNATTARHWRKLLGPSSEPPSVTFSSAVAPFLLSPIKSSLVQACCIDSESQSQSETGIPPLRLNSWTSFLVLLAIRNQIHERSQEVLTMRGLYDDNDSDSDDFMEEDESQWSRKSHSLEKRISGCCIHEKGGYLAESQARLSVLWMENYLHQPTSKSQYNPSSIYFYGCSEHLSRLSLILIDAPPLSDIQDAIGKSGHAGISQGEQILKKWIHSSPDRAHDSALRAIKTINSITPDSGSSEADTGPYGLITFFLCHVILWAFVSLAPKTQLTKLFEAAERDNTIHDGHFFPVIEAIWQSTEASKSRSLASGVSSDETLQARALDGPRLVFRSAAEVLIRLGTWGGALDLAMLLSRRAEV